MAREQVWPQRLRSAFAWVLSAALIGLYFWLPVESQTEAPPDIEEAGEQLRLDVVSVTPPEPYPGGLLVVDYVNSDGELVNKVFLAKQELPILSQRVGTVVVRLPSDAPVGRVKIRVGMKGQRSKPFDVRLEARNWQQPFRDFVGGFALLVFGIGTFSRGAREAAGKGSAYTLRKYGQNRLVAFVFGALVGGLSQSTLAAAALIAGLSASSLVTAIAAGAAFVGAQVGAGVIPLVTGLLDPRVGLIVIAIGVLWLATSSDRRTSAFARLALGAGLVAFGLYLLRNGIEPLVVDKTLLRFTAGLHADDLGGYLVCLTIGVVLTAILQGAASALFVVVGLMQIVGQLDLRVVLCVLAGSELGAALGALLTTRAGFRGRKLAKLQLMLGATSTLFALLTVDLWVGVVTQLLPSNEPIATFGANTLMPHVSKQLVFALGLSQLSAALIALPFVTVFNRWLERTSSGQAGETEAGDKMARARQGLLSILCRQKEGLKFISELALAGHRSAGREAEHRYSEARAELETLLARVIRALPNFPQGMDLRQAAFACLQLERSLEDLLFRAERFTDRQVALSARRGGTVGVAEYDTTTREMHEILMHAMDAAILALETEGFVDLEGARAREIRLNALEAQSRRAALESSGDSTVIQVRLDVLELLDAYESAGNHLYRLAETLGGGLPAYRMSSAR